MSKILVNALQFAKNGAGISRYAHKLSECLLEENNNIDILCRTEIVDEFKGNNNLIKVDLENTGSSKRIINEQLKSLKMYKNYDLVHFLDYATPVLYKGIKVATIHDVVMLTMKDKYTKGQFITKKILLENTIKYADKLVCISEFTAKELLRYYPNIDKSKIEVVYNGFEYKPLDIDEKRKTQILDKFNINKDYLLFVGTLSPHKNIERIIEAFNGIKNKGHDYKLVICGKKGWLYEEIFEKVKQLNLQDDVVFTDYVTDEELEVLYKNTKLFVFPSLYEGFGFPPIEAMARKVPVLTSREGALPEIVGDAALSCDAYDVKDISDKIIQGLIDEELRDMLIEKGVKRSEFFSWNKTSKEMNEIYRNLLNQC